MTKKFLSVLLISIGMTLTVTGCSNKKYEKDTSYETDLYGEYSYSLGAPSVSYSLDKMYCFNTDKTYNYICKEISNGTVLYDTNNSGKILSIKQSSDNISKIILKQEVYEPEQESHITLYKYKNM